MPTGGLHKLQQAARGKMVFIKGACTHLTFPGLVPFWVVRYGSDHFIMVYLLESLCYLMTLGFVSWCVCSLPFRRVGEGESKHMKICMCIYECICIYFI